MRLAHNEMCFTREEFKRLDFAKICRRYGLGEDWVDQERDKAAEAVAPQ